jgi:hypothetical protein
MQRYFQERLRAAVKELAARKSRDTNETKPERLQMKTNYTNFIVVRGLALGMGIACALCSTGCNTIVSEHQPIKTEIITDPPGARIEVNGRYIGDAPTAFTFRQDTAGNIVGNYSILATPVSRTLLAESGWLGPNLQVPPTLNFRLKPAAAFVASPPGASLETERPVDFGNNAMSTYGVPLVVPEVVPPSGQSFTVYPAATGTNLGDYSQPGFTVNGDASPSSFRTSDSYGNEIITQPWNLGPRPGGYRSTDNSGNVIQTTPWNLGPNNQGAYRTTDSYGNQTITKPWNLGPNHKGTYRTTDFYGNELFLTTPNHLGPNNEGSYRTTDSSGHELFRTTPNTLGPNNEGSYRATDSSGNVIQITPNHLGPNH